MNRKVCYFLIIGSVITLVLGCQTPNGKSGSCIPINKCRSLYSGFDQSSIYNTTTQYLKKSICFFDDNNLPVVCCPDQSTAGTTDGKKLLPDVCGTAFQSRIVGEKATEIGEFPWLALLGYETASKTKKFFCNGVLITKRYVMTAAHCASTRSLKLISVRLGEHNLNTDPDCVNSEDCAPSPLDIPVEEKVIHERYNSSIFNHRNDIALLRLKQEVQFSDFIKPICLPTTNQERLQEFVVAGWGGIENASRSAIKLKVQVPAVECNSSYGNVSNIMLTEDHLCAGGEKGRDFCSGNSGAPLMSLREDKSRDIRWTVVGIVSFGPSACGSNLPGVYTKVSNYVPWIMEKLKP